MQMRRRDFFKTFSACVVGAGMLIKGKLTTKEGTSNNLKDVPMLEKDFTGQLITRPLVQVVPKPAAKVVQQIRRVHPLLAEIRIDRFNTLRMPYAKAYYHPVWDENRIKVKDYKVGNPVEGYKTLGIKGVDCGGKNPIGKLPHKHYRHCITGE